MKEKLPDLSQQGQQKKLIKSQESIVLWLLCSVLISVVMLSHKEIPAFSKMHCYSFKPVSAGLLFLSISFSPRDAFLCRLSLFSVQTHRSQKPKFLHPSVPANLPQRAPLSAASSLQSYKYGRIKVKIFSISVLHRRRKCHPCRV